MSAISDLAFRYLHRKLGASNATPTLYTASGGTVRTAISAALTEADDYWNGAIVRWDSGLNAGLYSNVDDFDAATDTLTFDEDLPNSVSSLDTFTPLLGGLYASSQRIAGVQTSALVTVTGLSLTDAGMLNDEGTGTLRYYAGGTASWTPPGEAEGPALDVSLLALGATVTLYGAGATIEQRSKFVVLTRTAAALPVGSVSDDVSLDFVRGPFLAGVTGAEAEAGVTVYRPVGLRNTGSTPMYTVRAYCASPFPDAAAAAVVVKIGTGADTLEADDLSSWGTTGFIFNSTRGDVRYYYDRSGNTVTIMDPAGGLRGFTAVEWIEDDVLEPYPWFDIGLDAPTGGNAFEDPATRATAPSGVTFSCPRTAGTGLSIGDLAAGAVYTVWERFEIPAGFRPVEGARADLRIHAEVTS